MRNIIKFFLSLFIIVFCIFIFQRIRFTETTTTTTTEYWYEEMSILYLYYIK